MIRNAQEKEDISNSCTAFQGTRVLSSGSIAEVALAVKKAIECGGAESIFVFDDATGRTIELDLRGDDREVLERLSQPSRAGIGEVRLRRSLDPILPDGLAAPSRSPGRPKLGVVGREVTLLPQHWEWLAAHPSGASVVLRKLVDAAKRDIGGVQKARMVQERAYHFMHAIAGNFPGFEEATRALFANDSARFEQHVSRWPEDVRSYASRLAFGVTPVTQKSSSREDGATTNLAQPCYIDPTQESGREFIQRGIEGAVVMLNLLRFRKIADYSANPELEPSAPISGLEAYNRYMAHTIPYLEASGGGVIFFGAGGRFLVGPEHEYWDRVMLVRQSSVQSFLAFANNTAYLAGVGHRTAALEDSRLLPLTELPRTV